MTAARLAVAAAVALATGLRLALLREDSTWQRTDEVMFLLNALALHGLPGRPPLDVLRELFWLVAFPWGYPVVVLLWALLELYGVLGVPITEFTAVAPFALLGGVTPALVYLAARPAFGALPAVGAAFAIAVFPAHVAQSRTVAAWILASNLLLLAVARFARYLESGRTRDAWLASAALAAYLPSDNLFPGAIALLLGHTVLATPGSWRDRWRGLAGRLLRPAVLLLPALTLGPLLIAHAVLAATGRGTYGLIGHYFLGKVAPGVHADHLVRALADNGGPAMALLMGLGALRAVTALRGEGPGRLFGAWVVAFGVPMAVLVNPAGTTIAGYVTPLVIPLLALGSAAVVEAGRRWGGARGPRLAGAVLALAAAVTLVTIPPRIYEMPLPGMAARPLGLWGGEMYGNDGAKAAGYVIRTQTAPGTVVASDVRRFVGPYYFHRRTLPAAEADGRAEVLALTAAGRAGTRLEGWHLAAVLTHGGREVFYLYRRRPGPTVVLAAETLDPLFDREFGHPAALRYPSIWE